MSSKFHAVLSSAMTSLTILLHPAWDVNHFFVQHIHTLCKLPACPVSHLVALLVIRPTVPVSQGKSSLF